MKSRRLIWFCIVSVILGGLLLFLGVRVVNPNGSRSMPDQTGSGSFDLQQNRTKETAGNRQSVTFLPSAASNPNSNRAADPGLDQEITVRLQEWLTSSTDTAVIAERMARDFQTVKPEDQAAVARELIPLVTDDVYERRLPGIVLDPAVSAEAHQLFFRDLGLRPDEIELPLLLEIAKLGDSHPQSLEALLRLSVRFGGDPETPWETWQPMVEAEIRSRRELLGK